MNVRARKPCAQPGCPELATTGAYCDEHQPIDPRPGWATSQRTRLKGWHPAHRAAMAKTRGRCVVCGNRATVVDHLLPQAWGGTDDQGNLRPMCGRHHRAKTQDESRFGKRMKAHPEERPKLIHAFLDSWR